MTAPIEAILLLHADRDDPVARALNGQAQRLGAPLIALSLADIVDGVEIGDRWNWRGRSIEPARTAVVNRLSFEAGEAHRVPDARLDQQHVWRVLHSELQRFAYVSSKPTATSVGGCHGSLLDQWSDLPELIPGLRVPAHARRGHERTLSGDVHAIANPMQLYSLGRRPAEDPQTARHAQLWYVRPPGWLVHVAQVGGMAMFVNAPPTMSGAQQQAIVAFVRSMAMHSTSRILEHAFFVGDDLPVFYSTSPVPVISGSHPAYANLVIDGLNDDIRARLERRAS